METLLIQSESKKDMKMFADLAKKIGLTTKHLTNEALEDIRLAGAMKIGRTGEYVDTQSFFK
jgi:hypothetical protein